METDPIILGDEIAYDGERFPPLDPALAGRIAPLLPGPPGRLELLCDEPALVIRVRGGEDRIVRVQPAARMDKSIAWSLVGFLSALAEEPGLRTPRPLRLANGRWYAPMEVRGVPHRLSLLTWVDGESSGGSEFVEPARLRAVGAAVARMHGVATALPPGVLLGVRRRETDTVFDGAGRFDSGAAREAFALGAGDRFPAACERIGAALRVHTAPDRAGLVHGDLEAQNFVFDGEGRVGVIDFDELRIGSLALELLGVVWTHALWPDHDAIREELFAGYETVRPLPPGTREDANVLTAAWLVLWLREVLRAPSPRARARLESIFVPVAEKVLTLAGLGPVPLSAASSRTTHRGADR